MAELARQFILGAASIFLAPARMLREPGYRITFTPPTATDAISGDFARASGRSVERYSQSRAIGPT